MKLLIRRAATRILSDADIEAIRNVLGAVEVTYRSSSGTTFQRVVAEINEKDDFGILQDLDRVMGNHGLIIDFQPDGDAIGTICSYDDYVE